MIHAGILGSAGYTGGELLRLLLNHPSIERISPYSRSHANQSISSVHDDIRVDDLLFKDAESLKEDSPDVLFMALAHGESLQWLQRESWVGEAVNKGTIKLIDLSQDFRNEQSPAPNVSFVYGLPELNRAKIQQAQAVSNPGCFATAIQLSILPFGSTIVSPIHVTGITGSTGAGQTPTPTTHFSWRTHNVQPYKVLTHQHMVEVTTHLTKTFTTLPKIHFVPWRGPFSRGILVSTSISWEGTLEEATQRISDTYDSHPFVHVSDQPVHLKQVVGTNQAILSTDLHDGCLVINVVIDNLLKGASGQAVQNMNLMLGLKEEAGLSLSATR